MLGARRIGALERLLNVMGMPYDGWTRQPNGLHLRRYPGKGHLLSFEMSDVMPLALHALASGEHRPAGDQLWDKRLWHDPKAVLTRSDIQAMDNAHIDTTRVPAALELVSDSGVYLMSNGIPVQRSRVRRNECESAFAAGFNPYVDKDWQTWVPRIMGRQRFTTVIPLEWVRRAYMRGDSQLKIQLLTQGLRAYVT